MKAITKMEKSNTTICAYCEKTKEGISFVIGASTGPAWCMVEGTGKMTCPDCYEKAMTEGQKRIKDVTGI